MDDTIQILTCQLHELSISLALSLSSTLALI